MKTVIVALGLALATSTAAFACTQEELTAKAMDLSTKMQAAVTANPQAATEISQKVAALQATPPADMAEACTMYDELIVEIEAL